MITLSYIENAIIHFVELKRSYDNFSINTIREDLKKTDEFIAHFLKMAEFICFDEPQKTLDSLYAIKRKLEHCISAYFTSDGKPKKPGNVYNREVFMPFAFPTLESYFTKANPMYSISENDIIALGVVLIKRITNLSNENALVRLDYAFDTRLSRRAIQPLKTACCGLTDSKYELLLTDDEMHKYCNFPASKITI